MLDFDLAAMYGVETRVLNQAEAQNRVHTEQGRGEEIKRHIIAVKIHFIVISSILTLPRRLRCQFLTFDIFDI